MARTIYLDKLLRLTLTRKGRATAKHPFLREGAVEAVKATPLWETSKATPEDDDNATPGLTRFTTGRYQ